MRVYAGLVLSSLLVVTACGGESTEDAAANGSAPDSAAAQTSTRETVASTTPQDAVSVAATTTTDPGSPESDSDVVATSGPVTTLEPIAQATNPCDAAASILEAFSEFSESSDYQLQRERALAVLPAVVDSIAMVAPPADISEAWTSFSETWAITLGAYERGEDLDGYLGAVTEDTEERFGSVVGNVDDLVTVNDWLIANCGFAIYDM